MCYTQLSYTVVLLSMIPRCIFEKPGFYLIGFYGAGSEPRSQRAGTRQAAPTSLQHPPPLTGAAKASCTPEPPPPLPGEGQTASAFDHPLGAGRQHTYLPLSLMQWM